eukprot:410059_1
MMKQKLYPDNRNEMNVNETSDYLAEFMKDLDEIEKRKQEELEKAPTTKIKESPIESKPSNPRKEYTKNEKLQFVISYWFKQCKNKQFNMDTNCVELIELFAYGPFKFTDIALRYFTLTSVSQIADIKAVKYCTRSTEDDSDYRREQEECVILFVDECKCYYKNSDVYYSRGGQSGGTTEAEGYWNINDDGALILSMTRKGDNKNEPYSKTYFPRQLRQISCGYTIKKQ